MPLGANAAAGDPQDGPSRPPATSYGYGEQVSNQQQYSYPENERYGADGPEGYGNAGYQEEYGKDGYGDRSCNVLHKIVLGENLTTIANAYGVSIEALIEENGIEDPNLIVENQALCIPEADHESYGERGSYGEESYGPSNGENYGPSNGENYGPSNGENYMPSNGESDRQGNEPHMVPGIGYDPSTFNKEGGQEYGNSGPEYGNQEYGNQGYGEEQDGTYQEGDDYHVPGKGYDPNESYAPQGEPQYNNQERESSDSNDTETPSDPQGEPQGQNGG